MATFFSVHIQNQWMSMGKCDPPNNTEYKFCAPKLQFVHHRPLDPIKHNPWVQDAMRKMAKHLVMASTQI